MEKRIENHPILGESPKGKLVKFSYDGTTLEGYEGEPIAAALRVAGVMAHRYTAKRHEPRGVFCAIGRCTDCVMVVDGKPNVRTCITHVVRGNEYLSSAPKYSLLYKAFGWKEPVYIHVEHIMKDKQHKLAKRDGDASYQDLIKKGYLKEAVINYIALLGWAPKGEEEIFSLEELVKEFDIHGISKSPAIFDPMKLKAINAKYIKMLTPEAFYEHALPYLKEGIKREDIDLSYVASLLQARTEVFTEIPEMVDFIDELPDYDKALYVHKKSKTNEEIALDTLKSVLPVLEGLEDWRADAIHDALFTLIAEKGCKNAIVLYPLRVAVSGKAFTPGGGIEICYMLGKDDALARIRKGIEKLS